jgi:hypothetical protein
MTFQTRPTTSGQYVLRQLPGRSRRAAHSRAMHAGPAAGPSTASRSATSRDHAMAAGLLASASAA